MTVGQLQDITGLNFERGHKGPFRVLNKATEILNWDFRCSKYLRPESKRPRIAASETMTGNDLPPIYTSIVARTASLQVWQ